MELRISFFSDKIHSGPLKNGDQMSCNRKCYVLMKKDLEKVGMAGQLISVPKGYAENFLVGQGFARMVDERELNTLKAKEVKLAENKTVLESKTSMLAEKIKNTQITIAEKIHDNNKLYGSIKEAQIVDGLKEKGISINKKQVEFGKLIKSTGEYKVTIRLSAKLSPEVTVKVVAIS